MIALKLKVLEKYHKAKGTVGLFGQCNGAGGDDD